MTRVMMSKPYELMTDLKLFGKLSIERARKRGHVAASFKREFFFIALKYILYFPFYIMLKRLLSFWCVWHSLSNSDILISLSPLNFVLFSFSDWQQWLMLASILWTAQVKQGGCRLLGVLWSLQVSPEVKVALRKCWERSGDAKSCLLGSC